MSRFEARSGAARLVGDDRGGNAPLVFLHAGVADRRGWRDVTGRLERFRTVTYDRRGFGDTVCRPESFSHVRDLEAVLEAREIDRAILVGNSQGGRIAIDLALARPERIAALILVAPAISGAPEVPIERFSPTIQGLVAELEAAEEIGDLDAVNQIEAHIWLDGPEQRDQRVAGPARALFLEMNGQALAAADPGDEIPPPPAYDRLHEIAAPVLAIAGELDFSDVIANTRRVAERAPRGVFEMIPGVAHLPQLEDPEGFAELIGAFAGSVE